MAVYNFECEKYYRHAYDYMHYESNLSLAKKYVNKALFYKPAHIKSLILKGEILLCSNKTDESIECFKNALSQDINNVFCYSYLSALYNLKGDCHRALIYVNNAIKRCGNNKELLKECLRLKINLLIGLKLYNKAKKILDSLSYYLYSDGIDDLKMEFNALSQDPENKVTKITSYIY